VVLYFHCHPQGDKRYPAFQHQLINIAFGLQELGISYYSNINYWKTGKNNYLFNKSTITPEECDVVVTSHGEIEYNWKLPEFFKKKNSPYKTLYIDTADGLFTRSYSKELQHFDIILKQKSKGMWYPKNCKFPWTFGLSPYMFKNEEESIAFENRKKEILANYRHSHTFRKLGEKVIPQQLQLPLNKASEPLDYAEKTNLIENENDFHKLGFLQSGGRFHPNYLQRLRSTYACACFGGSIIPPKFFTKNKTTLRLGNYFYDNTNKGRLLELLRKWNLQIKHRYALYQWDSWRLWETFASGAVAIHVDFEKYGIQFPVMPENYKHYIGIDLGNPKNEITRIKSLTNKDWETIGKNGAEWARTHYSPKAVAKRFLSFVNQI